MYVEKEAETRTAQKQMRNGDWAVVRELNSDGLKGIGGLV